MKQPEIVVGIVLVLALAVGVVYATGGFETGGLNNSTEMNPVIVKDAVVSRTIDNTTNATENKTIGAPGEPGPGIVNAIVGMFSNVVETSSSGGSAWSSSSSGGSSSSSSSSGGTPVTPTATETPCPTNEPTATPTVKVTATPTTNEKATPTPTTSPTATATTTPVPAATTELTSDSTPTVSPTIDPTSMPTPEKEITTETWTGTAGVTRTYYYIVDHAAKTTSIIAESEFPAEINDTMMYYALHDYIYHFSNVELRNIYLHFHYINHGPNGEWDYEMGGGPSIASRFGHEAWLGRWEYPVTETVILIYSENVPVYVVSTVDFVYDGFVRDPYTGEEDYIPRKYYGKQEVMPEKQPGKPRYYDLPGSAPIRLYREGRPDNPYLPATPTPTESPTATSTLTDPTPSPTVIETPSPVGTSVPQPTPVQHLPPHPTATPPRDDREPPKDWTPPTIPPATPSTTPKPTPIEEPAAEPTVEEPTLEVAPIEEPEPEEIPAFIPELTEEPIEEQTPVEGGNETN